MPPKRTLLLASPLMAGADVRTAQRKLIRAGFLRKGQDDGQYGPESARSAQLAHWELGFPADLANAATYGDVLDRVLDAFVADGDAGLADDYRRRRRDRLRAGALGRKALEALRQHVGDTERPPGSNRMPWASEWYMGVTPEWSARNWTTARPGPAWCGCAVTRAYSDAGSKLASPMNGWAYVPTIVAWAREGSHGLARTFDPAPGDFVMYDWDGNGTFDHVGLVDEPPDSIAAGQRFSTVEGNTSFDSGGSQSNGGACAERGDRVVLSGGRVIFAHATR